MNHLKKTSEGELVQPSQDGLQHLRVKQAKERHPQSSKNPSSGFRDGSSVVSIGPKGLDEECGAGLLAAAADDGGVGLIFGRGVAGVEGANCSPMMAAMLKA